VTGRHVFRSSRFEVRAEVLHLALADPFRIARDPKGDRVATVIVSIREAGARDAGGDAPPAGRATARGSRDETRRTWPGAQDAGLGEGFPDAYYGETPETVLAVLPLLLDAIDPLAADFAGDLARGRAALERASDAMGEAIRRNGAAKCALDIALHDLVARRHGIPVNELLGLPAEIPPTDFTVGLDEPEIVAARAARAARFPALKVKVGGPADLETLEAVRRVYRGPIRVDANTGWRRDEAARLIPELVRLGVELVEQPFPAHRLDLLRWLQERSALPIVADESAVTIEDLDGLVGVVAGINVKLAKCGGVGPAKRMLEQARRLGFRRFLGCMEETRVGIAASAVVASLAEWVDLDGCLLLADDPFEGLDLDGSCCWRIGSAPGLGVRRVRSLTPARTHPLPGAIDAPR
jgi:L-alanine-DL-glutamate epimerase-like enolase superfamily enzyme